MAAYLGLMLMILLLELEATNLLLMNKPVGKVIICPLGAWSSTWSDIMSELGNETDKEGRAFVGISGE